MKFHEYALTKNATTNLPQHVAKLNTVEYYYMLDQEIKNGWDPGETRNLILCEIGYVRCKRPFYHVYPAVETCLENTKLNFELKQIGHLDEVIAMCFAVGKEPVLHNGKITSMLVELAHSVIISGEVRETPMLRISFNRTSNEGKQCFSSIIYNRPGLISESIDEFGDKRKLVSLAVGVAILAQDERFAEPILLARDERKKFATEEDYKKAVERAKKRGRRGIAIGKGIELSPHMRRPHFAVRWTGIGRGIPKLVPVKGCVVSREKLFPVPTGHLDN